MADKGRPIKKADIILKYGRSNFRKLNTLLERGEALEKEVSRISAQSESIYKAIVDEVQSIKRELKYLAMQNENIFVSVSEKVEKVADAVERAPAAMTDGVGVAEIDYDLLAEKVAAKIPVPQVASDDQPVSYVTHSAEIDYDLLADKLVARMPVRDAVTGRSMEEHNVDYDYLAAEIVSRLPAQNAPQYVQNGNPTPVNVQVAEPKIDYDYLADKVVSRIPMQESVSPDYIASKVAEQLVMPRASGGNIDVDELSDKLASKIHVPAGGEVDYDYIADKLADKIKVTSSVADNDCDYIAEKVAEKIVIPETRDLDYDYLAGRVAEKVVIPESRTSVTAYAPNAGYEVNEEELADAIALKVGSLKPEDFEILVDDEGCKSISREITEKLDYDIIAAAVAEKLRAALDIASDSEPDYDEMAARISEKITVAGVNEEAIADKAAAVLSNYLPDYDSDEIADKVAEQVISAMPAVINQDVISETVSSRLIESQQDNDYEIVLDEEGLDKISDKVCENSEERFDNIDKEIAEIKQLLANGVKVSDETATTEVIYSNVPEESVVTVSDIIDDGYYEEEPVEEVVEEPVEEVVEETAEEVVEEPVEEVAEESVEEEVVEEPVEEVKEVTEQNPPIVIIAETQEEDEEAVDLGDEEGDEGKGGVDFANMMRYNRSFIARIIQSTDEQKKYYGEVRNALLSYRRVNSNIAWGAERFHKGRETIARFKIRGKTLVLYLALDPATHEYSVYHHKDVSDNKSLSGTPMMIKIMSPRGVKKAVRLIDEMLAARDGIKRPVPSRDYAAMYPYETIDELIDDGLVKDVNK